jgi:hypothetical protein
MITGRRDCKAGRFGKRSTGPGIAGYGLEDHVMRDGSCGGPICFRGPKRLAVKIRPRFLDYVRNSWWYGLLSPVIPPSLPWASGPRSPRTRLTDWLCARTAAARHIAPAGMVGANANLRLYSRAKLKGHDALRGVRFSVLRRTSVRRAGPPQVEARGRHAEACATGAECPSTCARLYKRSAWSALPSDRNCPKPKCEELPITIGPATGASNSTRS